MSELREGLLTIVVPAYNEQELIEKTFITVKQIMDEAGISFEVLFVNDGSTDETYLRTENLARTNAEVRGISFSRNFGKEAAIFAGLTEAKGDCVVVMDCDLQHPPKTIVEMYRLWQQGYEVIEGVKSSRGREGIFHKMFAGIFYSWISSASHMDMRNASDFKLLDRCAIDSLIALPERAPFFRALSSWVGFKTVQIPFEVAEREAGESKWSFWKLTKYAISNITSFSGAPLQIVTTMGTIMLIFSVILGVQSLVKYFSGNALEGFTTVILLLLIIGSVLMLSLGIIGHYISAIYDEIKCRPRYIIDKKCGKN